MKSIIHAMGRMPRRGIVVIGLIGVCVLFAGRADAEMPATMLTPKNVNGTIEVLLAGETSWQSIAGAASLRSGDQVRSMPGSSVELWFDDGSLLQLDESTQILLKDIEISQAEKSRVAKVSLVFGAVTAKITKTGYTQSLCEIDTGTVLAGVKFSQATVRKSQDDSIPDTVIVEQGMVDIQQIGQGDVRVVVRIDDEEGMDFLLNTPGTMISLNVQNLLRRITLISENAISGISSLIGAYNNFLKIEGLGESPVLGSIEAQQVAIYENSQGSIGIMPERQLQIEASKAAFTFQQGDLQGDVLMVFNHTGKVTVNGEEVAPGSFKSIPLGTAAAEEGKSRTLQQSQQPRKVRTDKENPVEPPSKKSEPSKGGGLEKVPTVEPTPTEIPFEEPTVTPNPTAMPTVTPKPTVTPIIITPEPINPPSPSTDNSNPQPEPTAQPTLPPQPTPTMPSPSRP